MSLNQNQFSQVPVLGQLDLAFNTNTISSQMDSASTSAVAGQSVKLVDSAGGVPKVIPVASDSDIVFGFIAYNLKDSAYVANDACEVAMLNNVMYLLSTEAIGRGAKVKGVVATVGGVAVAVAASGSPIVGWAFDKATASGQLIRIFLGCPSYFLA